MTSRRALFAACAFVLGAGSAMAQTPPRVGALATATARPGQTAAMACADLARQALAQARVTSAQAIASGPFTPPAPAQGPAPAAVNLPAHCKVAATLTPTPDSEIRMELWLPAAGWNGKFVMVGNGGWSGAVPVAAMAEPLRRGYAVAATDTGHQGNDASFAYGHPEKVVDFAYRAVHETVVTGKALTTTFFGAAPHYAYWNGCSSGGRQGLKAIQQYPADFDGAVIGAPAHNWINLQARLLTANLANRPRGAEPVLGPDQFAILHRGSVARCDERDGLKDGQIADPRACDATPAALVCKAGDAVGTCLTPAQAAAAERIYAPLRDPRTGAVLVAGLAPGSELGWGGAVSRRWAVGAETFALASGRRDWDDLSFDAARDLAAARAWDPGLDATSTDLSAFIGRGGKVIHYHGWADPLIPAENSLNWYEAVAAGQGGDVDDAYRLFLVPAMAHCNGTYAADWLSALEQWVEAGRAPDRILANHLPPPGQTPAPPPPGAVVFAPQYGVRAICAYPAVARLQSGNGEQPVDWICQAGPRGARPGHLPPRPGRSSPSGRPAGASSS